MRRTQGNKHHSSTVSSQGIIEQISQFRISIKNTHTILAESHRIRILMLATNTSTYQHINISSYPEDI